RDWKDAQDLVDAVDSPWLKMCLDLPMMVRQDPESVRQAATTVGPRQAHTHFGGEFSRNAEGRLELLRLDPSRPPPASAHFIRLMREIGYDGYFSYELCHPVLGDRHEVLGLDYVHDQVRLASAFMRALLAAE